MVFTPPSCSLRIDHSHDVQPIDPMPVSFAYPAAAVTMMAQPNVDSRKAVKFAEPLVQGNFFHSCFMFSCQILLN